MTPIVLIVDDDQQTLLLIEQVLKTSNVSVIRAEDGAQALEVLEEMTPDVMLLDMLMPHVGGADVLQYVSQTPRLDGMFVAIVSAHRQLARADEAARANAYLVKPIRPGDIREALSRALDQDN
ncbi:MAG: response regulator [Anaerolineae bacterium]|nr:response regulator [Anaerolineae bacterium]